MSAPKLPGELDCVVLTQAAGRIIDIMCGGNFDWRDLEDSTFLESADWLTAMAYARAALNPATSEP